MNKKGISILRVLDRADAFVATLMLAAIFIDVVLQVLTRILPGNAISWTGEMGEILLGALIWVGIGAAVKTNGHIGLDLVVNRLSPRGKRIMGLINLSLFTIYLSLLGCFAWQLMGTYVRFKYKMPILGIGMWWIRLPIFVGCVVGVVRLLIKIYMVAVGKERMYETSVHAE